MSTTSTTLSDPFNKIDYTKTLHPSGVEALSLKDAPALIESLLPAQKLSIDVFKERSAVSGQLLTSLGSYWKGRKPLVLNRACVLASLLPATDNPIKDLEVFEMLMGMDDISLSKRLGLASIRDIVSTLGIDNIWKYFTVSPAEQKENLPSDAPFDLNDYPYVDKKGNTKLPTLTWRSDLTDNAKHELASRLFESKAYRELASEAKRAEEIADEVSTHIWPTVNSHLGTKAKSYPELVEQLGVMRFGHRPTVADTFSGSGQIPFAAAQLGCDVYASDLNPIACMLTWGAFNLTGASKSNQMQLAERNKKTFEEVEKAIKRLEFSSESPTWIGKTYFYCLEVTCPSSGWKVPVLPTLVVSKSKHVIAKLIPVPEEKRYQIKLLSGVNSDDLKSAEVGTYIRGSVVHRVDGVEHSNPITLIRGDYSEVIKGKKVTKNKLRLWEKSDIVFRDEDIYNERLYAIQWVKNDGSSRPETEFRTVTAADEIRESAIAKYVQDNLANWQEKGWVPDMRIEPGFNTSQPIWERGWTHWHHLFNPRQLLISALLRAKLSGGNVYGFTQLLNRNSRLSHVHQDNPQAVFYNQALNTFFTYGARGVTTAEGLFVFDSGRYSVISQSLVENKPAYEVDVCSDIFITDPPYGDAVKYEEILEFFIAWLRKNPPAEFANWTWDSRRELAVKGEDHDFKLSMVKAYKRMAECMPDNGLQIIMFTHQDGNIWADMANIVWASGLRVTAAWYLVTETDSALREGSYVKGTILLVLRKRLGSASAFQTELAMEIEDEVANQVRRLTGLNDDVAKTKRAKDGNLFEDADLQMAGYAAALKVLTQYSNIDGKDMAQEALRERIKGQKMLVDELIDFAVATANRQLVPIGLSESVWGKLNPSERFYLKMADLESKGMSSLDNYQNFAKAFSVRDWNCMMASDKANKAKLKTAVQFGKTEMGSGSELANTSTRAVLYALMEMQAGKDVEDAVKTMQHNMPNFYAERQTVIHITKYLANKRAGRDEAEAAEARILAMYLENQGA